jgi:hypothetical protein
VIESRASLSWLSIFTSSSTLLCCALPALLVALGAGAALSSLVGAFPQIVWLSEHKVPLFIVAGVMLAAAGALQWRARRLSCPPDAALASACATTRDASLIVYWMSVAMFATGALFAFVIPLFV